MKAGLGKSMLPCCVADRDPALRRIGRPVPEHRREIWLMVHPELRNLVRTRVTLDWLIASVDAFVDSDSSS